MDALFQLLLIIHIITGSMGLLSGTIALIRRKGNSQHRLTGKVFAVSMIVAGASSLALAIIHPNYFLFIVGIFTLYMTGTGWRYLVRRRSPDQRASAVDYILTYGMLCAAIVFIAFGIYLITQGENFGIVFLAFGGVSLRWIITDIRVYRSGVTDPSLFITSHLQRMMGAYIASATAFIVVNNNNRLPALLVWLLPTIVITPLIIKWSRSVKKQYA